MTVDELMANLLRLGGDGSDVVVCQRVDGHGVFEIVGVVDNVLMVDEQLEGEDGLEGMIEGMTFVETAGFETPMGQSDWRVLRAQYPPVDLCDGCGERPAEADLGGLCDGCNPRPAVGVGRDG